MPMVKMKKEGSPTELVLLTVYVPRGSGDHDMEEGLLADNIEEEKKWFSERILEAMDKMQKRG